MGNNIELKSIKELLDMKFFIPNYQRGYRWTQQQVEDLLNDIAEFAGKKHNDYEFYCLQPLVVKQMSENAKIINHLDVQYTWYEVIDGQQRLTTLFIILANLKDAFSLLGLPTNSYELEFQRKSLNFDCGQYLKGISSITNVEDFNIDAYHISKAHYYMRDWLAMSVVNKGDFCNALLKSDYDKNIPSRDKANNVRFIWYESTDEDPIKVFTRLNIGKIPLTNSELIKALFLNRTNFGNKTNEHVMLRQQEIASEWDRIEYTLQNEEFWLFLHETGYKRPTRIDFIFDLICDQHSLGEFENIGNDQFKTFRYFYEYFKLPEHSIEKCWAEVKKYFQTFQEWYNDLELFHYVGYLIEYKYKLSVLIEEWNRKTDKKSFISYSKSQIRKIILSCPKLDNQYKEDGGDKGKCKPILLFHNVQTVINQNSKNIDSYGLGMFYKFPFHLYKMESWDVEHINSNTTNLEDDETTRREWLMNVYLVVNEEIQEKIRSYFNDKSVTYEELKDKIPSVDNWTPEEKNRIWNYALLDSSTNRSYGNTIFSGKRRIIIGKDQGKLLAIPKLKRDGTLEIGNETDARSSFVPPCTKQVFMKYYSASLSDFNYWDKETDAPAYLKDIEKCIKQLEENSNEL